MEKNIDKSVKSLIGLLKESLSGKILKAEFSWDISEKTISEIGGRLIEDFILCELPRYIKNVAKTNSDYEFVQCIIPQSQRAMQDIEFVWKYKDVKYHLLVDIKGHNELKLGSRPNLASIRKCKDFYSDKKNLKNNEFYIFFCRYQPIITKESGTTKIEYRIKSDSFTEKGIFPLKYLSENNMDPANIGSGGQILLARETEIELVQRTDKDFLAILDRFTTYLDEYKEKKK